MPLYLLEIFHTASGRRPMVPEYVALGNGEHAMAIDTLTNKVIAEIPIGQTTQALCRSGTGDGEGPVRCGRDSFCGGLLHPEYPVTLDVSERLYDAGGPVDLD